MRYRAALVAAVAGIVFGFALRGPFDGTRADAGTIHVYRCLSSEIGGNYVSALNLGPQTQVSWTSYYFSGVVYQTGTVDLNHGEGSSWSVGGPIVVVRSRSNLLIDAHHSGTDTWQIRCK